MRFGNTRVDFPPGRAITTLPDGLQVLACPQDNDAYRDTARRLGYGSDTLRMMREHEALHSWLAHIIALPESPTLSNVAHERGDTRLTGLEEQAVMAIAALANEAGINLLQAFCDSYPAID